MTTDISEKGLETIIMRHMTGTDGLDDAATMVAETPDELAAQKADGIGYWAGNAREFDRAHRSMCRNFLPFFMPRNPRFENSVWKLS